MNDIRMWIMVVLAAFLVIGMLRYARGPEHHHGDDVGAWSPPISHAESV
jgi:hypothetical protein